MEKKKKKKSPFIIFIVAAVIVSFVISFFKEGVGIFRPLLYIAKLVYFAVMNTPGEDLAALFLVVTVFSLGAIAAIAVLIPKINFRNGKRTKTAVWGARLAQIVLIAFPIAVGAVVDIKLSLWFIVPVLILAATASLYLIFWFRVPKILRKN